MQRQAPRSWGGCSLWGCGGTRDEDGQGDRADAVHYKLARVRWERAKGHTVSLKVIKAIDMEVSAGVAPVLRKRKKISTRPKLCVEEGKQGYTASCIACNNGAVHV